MIFTALQWIMAFIVAGIILSTIFHILGSALMGMANFYDRYKKEMDLFGNIALLSVCSGIIYVVICL